jgi:CHAT domain-containing protein
MGYDELSSRLSLWNVNDSATYSLMRSYYSRLLKGEGRDEALHNTQRTMLGLQYKHPHYWAGFFQSGDWKPLPNIAVRKNQK